MRFDSRPAVRWWASLALLLPVIVLYAAEYLGGSGGTFTGFIQYDQPYYMANARKFFDGGFHLLYSNPFSADPNSPGIYFQIHLFVLGAIQAATGCDPGLLYEIFGFFAALICVRVAIALYEQVAGLDTAAKWLGLVLFIWGGGVMAATGLCYHLIQGSDVPTTLNDLFRFDPSEGWWFLNLGRNLIFPTEAYYHALALGAVLMVMRNNFRAALWLMFFLTLSHPFTGLQFPLVVLSWCVLEMRFFSGNRNIPVMFPIMLFCLLVFHLVYNLILLNRFFEHLVVFTQWSLPWVVPVSTVLCGDILVGLLAVWAMRSRPLATRLFSSPANRLLLVWFVVSFLLAHHDLIFTPRQPLHFTRGYTWIPLFLLGVQPLIRMLESGLDMRSMFLRATAVGFILVVGLADNLTWFGLHIAMAVAPRCQVAWLSGDDAFRTDADDRQLYDWLMKRPKPHSELLIAPEDSLSVIYLAMAYTDYRAWFTHFEVTPFARQRRFELDAFFERGVVPPEWKGRPILAIFPKGDSHHYDKWVTSVLFENKSYVVQNIGAP